MNEERHKMYVWRVRDWTDIYPTEEIVASTNTEALDIYMQKHGIDTREFHLIEATPLRRFEGETHNG